MVDYLINIRNHNIYILYKVNNILFKLICFYLMTNNISFKTNYLMMLFNDKKSENKITTPFVYKYAHPKYIGK